MKIKINDYLKTFIIGSIVYGLLTTAWEYFDSTEINVWKLIVQSMSGGALFSFFFVTAIRRAGKDHEIPPRDEKNKKE